MKREVVIITCDVCGTDIGRADELRLKSGKRLNPHATVVCNGCIEGRRLADQAVANALT